MYVVLLYILRQNDNMRFYMLQSILSSVVIVAPCAPISVHAQTINWAFPNPIEPSEVEQYAEVLSLSAGQRDVIGTIHGTYLRAYEELRRGHIAPWVESTKDSVSCEAIRVRRQIESRIIAQDRQFFDEIQSVLTDSQVAELPKMLIARDRRRYATYEPLWRWGWKAIDVGAMVRAEPKAVDPLLDGVLAEYEQGLSARYRELYRTYERLLDQCCDELAAMGLADASPERRAEVDEARAKFWLTHKQDMLDVSYQLGTFNRTFYRRLRDMLPRADRRALRNAFFRAYLQADLRPFDQHVFDSVLARDDLTEAERVSVEAADARFDAEIDAVLEPFADNVDEFRRRHLPWEVMDMPQEERRARQEVRAQAAQQLDAARSRANEFLELSRREASSPPVATQSSGKPLGYTSNEFGVSHTAGTDLFASIPLSEAELQQICQRFRLAPERVSEIVRRHDERCAEIMTAEIAQLNAAYAAMYREGSINDKELTIATASRLIDARAAMITAMKAVDDQLFQDVAALAGRERNDPLVQRCRAQRWRSCLNRGVYGGGFGPLGPGQRNDCSIDLAFLLSSCCATASHSPAIDSILQGYEAALTPLHSRKFDAMVRYDAVAIRRRAEWREALRSDPALRLAPAHLVDDAARAAQREIVQSNAEIVTLNEATLARLLDTLPPSDASSLQRRYEALAFPRVFDDPASASQALARALGLPELRDDQRMSLQQIAAEYQPAYEELSKRMCLSVDSEHSIVYSPDGADTWQKHNARRDARIALAFERYALSMRVLGKLRTLLSDEQLHAIGGLPKIDDFKPKDFGY